MSEDSYTENTHKAIHEAQERVLDYRVDGLGNVWVTRYVGGKKTTVKL